MKPEHARRWIGGVAVLLGLWWIWAVVVPQISGIWSGESKSFNIGFLLTFVPLMATPGVLAVVFGVRLFRKMQESSVKWVVGVGAVFFAFCLSSQMFAIVPEILPEGLQHSVTLFVASLVAIVAYLLAVRLLLRYFTQKDRPLPSLLSRGALILMAWQVWLLLLEVFREYSPIQEGYNHVPKEPWGTLGFLVPIAVAYGLYRVAMSKLTKAQEDAAEPPAPAGQST